MFRGPEQFRTHQLRRARAMQMLRAEGALATHQGKS